MQKYPKYLITFRVILENVTGEAKTVVTAILGNFWGKIGLLFVLTSGHTGSSPSVPPLVYRIDSFRISYLGEKVENYGIGLIRASAWVQEI